MALSDLILQQIPTMGLWFVKTKTTSMDISQLIYDLSVKGSVFLQIYSSDKERIVNSVISMITKDRLQKTTCPCERLLIESEMLIESEISYFHEFGFFGILQELNEYISNGYFWAHQVKIYDFDPLFVENCETEVILIDEIQMLKKYKDEPLVSALRQTERIAMKHGKTIFVFVYEQSSILADEFILKRLINA